MIVILLILIVILILFNSKIQIYLKNDSFEVSLFYIKCFSVKGDKFESLLLNIYNSQDFSSEESISNFNNVIDCLIVDKLDLHITTIVNNYNEFIYQNIIGNIYLTYIYPYMNNKIKTLNYSFKKALKNELLLKLDIKINVFLLLIKLIGGKFGHARKTN